MGTILPGSGWRSACHLRRPVVSGRAASGEKGFDHHPDTRSGDKLQMSDGGGIPGMPRPHRSRLADPLPLFSEEVECGTRFLEIEDAVDHRTDAVIFDRPVHLLEIPAGCRPRVRCKCNRAS